MEITINHWNKGFISGQFQKIIGYSYNNNSQLPTFSDVCRIQTTIDNKPVFLDGLYVSNGETK
jgi:hypothetical protein